MGPTSGDLKELQGKKDCHDFANIDKNRTIFKRKNLKLGKLKKNHQQSQKTSFAQEDQKS